MDPRFRYLMESNIVPSELETRQMKDLLLEEDAHLSDLNAQMVQLQASLQALAIQRSQRCARIRSYKAAISGVRRLPPEIVAEIFLRCCPESPILPLRPTDSHMVVTQICSGWRKVAIGFPELWHKLSLVGRADEQATQSKALACAKGWIGRAGPLPLEVHIANFTGPTLIDDIIRPHANRFREIAISDLPLSPFLAIPSNSFSLLESLTLSAHPHGSEDTAKYLLDATLDSAPKLHDFTLQGYVFNPATIRLPWAQLTRLQILDTPVTPNTCLAVLEMCTSLVSCRFEIITSVDAITFNPSSLLLPHLSTLNLVEAEPQWIAHSTTARHSVTAVIDCLDLPALKDLTLPLHTSEACDAFIDLASRSKFSLEKLTISPASVWFSEVLEQTSSLSDVLEQTPSLLSFDYNFLEMNTGVLYKMSRYELLPELQTLRVCFNGQRQAELAAMIDNRRPSTHHRHPMRPRLKNLILSPIDHFHDLDSSVRASFPNLDQWRLDGLSVSY